MSQAPVIVECYGSGGLTCWGGGSHIWLHQYGGCVGCGSGDIDGLSWLSSLVEYKEEEKNILRAWDVSWAPSSLLLLWQHGATMVSDGGAGTGDFL